MSENMRKTMEYYKKIIEKTLENLGKY